MKARIFRHNLTNKEIRFAENFLQTHNMVRCPLRLGNTPVSPFKTLFYRSGTPVALHTAFFIFSFGGSDADHENDSPQAGDH
jgi:hypothetical protein